MDQWLWIILTGMFVIAMTNLQNLSVGNSSSPLLVESIGKPFSNDTVKELSDRFFYNLSLETVVSVMLKSNIVIGATIIANGQPFRTVPNLQDFFRNGTFDEFIDIHNHPKGSLCGPSESDIQTWKKLDEMSIQKNVSHKNSVIIMNSTYYDRNLGKVVWFRKSMPEEAAS